MNLLEKTNDEILEIAEPMWDELVVSSNKRDYLGFIKHFSKEMLMGANEIEIGKQWTKNKMLSSLSVEREFLGCLRRGEYITVLYKQTSDEVSGEFLGRLVLGIEEGEVKIFGATIFQNFSIKQMSNTITTNKFVELTYRIIDQTNGEVIEQVEEPLGYVQGDNTLLFNQVTKELEGKSVGDEVEILLKAEDAFGPKLEELIFTDDINNVPLEYRFIGAAVTMQNDKGGTKDFIVSSIEDGKLTIDGNHPLAGKDIIFYVEVLSVRDATADEIIEGGSID